MLAALSAWSALAPASAQAQPAPGSCASSNMYPCWSTRTSPIGHAAYGLGFASGPRESTRSVLDVAGGVWLAQEESRGTMFNQFAGWLIHGTLTTGFKASPTYLGLGAGYAWSAGPGVAGTSVSGGPVSRVGSIPAFGGEARGTLALFFIEIGLSAKIVHGSDGTDFPLIFTIGLGLD